MKFDRIFLTLCFIFIAINCFSSVISSDVVTDVNVKQIGENIKITYKLSEKADITAYVSVDGGISYSPITEVSGDVGVDIKFGDKYIIWYVLRERDEFIYDNVCFKIVAKTEPKYSQKVKEYYQAQKEFDMDWFGLNVSLGSNWSVGLSAFRLRYKWIQLCPAEVVVTQGFVSKELKYFYQPTLNFVIPINAVGAFYLGGGPSISFKMPKLDASSKEASIYNSDNTSTYNSGNTSEESNSTTEDFKSEVWFKVEVGYRFHWGKSASSDFFFRYDGGYTGGVSVFF
jgi:hypothetical protein